MRFSPYKIPLLDFTIKSSQAFLVNLQFSQSGNQDPKLNYPDEIFSCPGQCRALHIHYDSALEILEQFILKLPFSLFSCGITDLQLIIVPILYGPLLGRCQNWSCGYG